MTFFEVERTLMVLRWPRSFIRNIERSGYYLGIAIIDEKDAVLSQRKYVLDLPLETEQD